MQPNVLHKHNLANRDANGMLQQTRPTLAAYNKKRAQPVTTAVNHMTLQNCRYKLTWSTMCWRNKIRQTEMLLKRHNTRPRLPAYNNKRVQSVTRAVNHLTLQNRTFFEHQPTLEGKPSTKMTTKHGQDKSQLSQVAIDF